MSTKIGHFEILSELSKSATGAVYKANDPQTGQTVALKAIQLSAFGERAGDLEKCLLEEAETTKVLSHSNLTPVYGAGEIEGQFCAAMEYIQGNSVATMLTRRQQAHEAVMVRNLTPGNEAFRNQVNSLKGFFNGGGNGAAGDSVSD